MTNVPGNHYIFADYKTTAGWNYTYGGQEIECYNTGQFSFASSTFISVSSPWVFGFSTGTTK